MGWQKSLPNARAAPARSIAISRSHVPQAKSSARPPSQGFTARTAFARHNLSTFAERTWFKKSYRGATRPNIPRTQRDACSSFAAPSGVVPFEVTM
jgi:hypothetical protein